MVKKVATNYIMKVQLYQLSSTLILALFITSCVATDAVSPRSELTLAESKRKRNYFQYAKSKSEMKMDTFIFNPPPCHLWLKTKE